MMHKLVLRCLLIAGLFFPAMLFSVDTKNQSKDIIVTPAKAGSGAKVIESFDFNNVDVLTLTKQISKLTGKRFIVNEALSSKKGITIVAPTAISVQEAYNVFLTVMDSNGLAVVKSGQFLKIIEKDKVTSGVTIYKNDYYPRNDEYITRLIKLKNLNATDLLASLGTAATGKGATGGFFGNDLKMKALEDTNTILVTGTGSQIADFAEMVALLDVKSYNAQLAIIPIKNADANNIKDIIYNLIFQSASTSSTAAVRAPIRAGTQSQQKDIIRGAERYSNMFVDDRTNSILVLANEPGIKKIKGLISKLDFEMEGGSDIHVYKLKHAKAEELSVTLTAVITGKTGSATATGVKDTNFDLVKLTSDKQTNSLVISAKPKQYEELAKIIDLLDRRKGQVLFETITMEISLNDDSSFGISSNYALSSEVPRAVGFDAGVSSSNTIMNFLTNPSALSGMILGFGSKKTVSVTLGGTTMKIPTLSAFINALEKNSEANVIQRPSVITSDNEEATITVMDKIPVVKGTVVSASGLSQQNIEMIDVGLSLKITPRISEASDFMKVAIEQEVSNITDKAPKDLAGTTQATNSRKITTSVVVRDKDTVVIGGLLSDNVSTTYNKVPILGDIPLLGWFFKGKTSRSSKTNLIVFITPNIIRDYETHSDLSKKALQSRKGFVKQNFGGEDKYGQVITAIENKIDVQAKTPSVLDEKNYMPDNGVKPIKVN